MLLFINNLVVI